MNVMSGDTRRYTYSPFRWIMNGSLLYPCRSKIRRSDYFRASCTTRQSQWPARPFSARSLLLCLIPTGTVSHDQYGTRHVGISHVPAEVAHGTEASSLGCLCCISLAHLVLMSALSTILPSSFQNMEKQGFTPWLK